MEKAKENKSEKKQKNSLKSIVCTKIYVLCEKCLNNEKPQLYVTSALSFATVLYILIHTWPIRSLLSMAYTLITMVIALAIIIFLTKCVFVNALITLSERVQPFIMECEEVEEVKRQADESAKEYKEKKAKDVKKKKGSKTVKAEKTEKTESKKKAKTKDLNTGPVPEVSIKYFIEKEKELSVYNAVYIGRV